MLDDEWLAYLASFCCRGWSLATHLPGDVSQLVKATSSSSNQDQWSARPKGPLLWFHALTLGETAVVLPVVFRCLLEYNEHVHVLLTTKSAEAIALLSNSLPPRVLVQDVPLDSYISMGRFLEHFRPQACILMESPAWPVLVESCAARDIKLGLLNARMSSRAFLSWFQPRMSRALLRRMLTNFSLIVPQSDIDVGRFRIFGATLTQMPGWCSDLKYAAALGNSVWHLWRPKASRIASLLASLCGRPMWVAAHTQPGEEEAVATVHEQVSKDWPSLLTVLAPASSSLCREVLEMLQTQHGLKVVLWSSVVDTIAPQPHKQQQQQHQQLPGRSSTWLTIWQRGSNSSSSREAEGRPPQTQQQLEAAAAGSNGSDGSSDAVDPSMLLKGVDVLLLDLQADLPLMYSVSEVAFIGSSLLEGMSGHNLAEAAVAGCAVLVGEHAGHFSNMADELNQAAVVAAEEASAAVHSSGPLEDPFFAAVADSGTSTGGAAPTTAAGAGTSGVAADAAAAGGAAGSEVEAGVALEAGESEEPSPRDGSHWRGVLNYTHLHEDDPQQQYQQQQYQHQQHNHHHQQQQQQDYCRPSTAPAVVSGQAGPSSHAAGSNSAAAAASAGDGSSSGGGAFEPPVARNTAAFLYRRHARTGSSANSSCVGSPLASQRPSTAGGSAAGPQQQQQQPVIQQAALQLQQQQQQAVQQQQDAGGQQQQGGQQLLLQQQQQRRGPGPSPLQQSSSGGGGHGSSHTQQRPGRDGLHHQQQQQQQSHRSEGGGCRECGEAQRCPAVERPLPQAPPPSAATNTPVQGPTGTVTPVGSYGGAPPVLQQQPDGRELAQRLAQQQQQQGGLPPQQQHQQQRTLEGAATQQQVREGAKQQQAGASSSSSGGSSSQPPPLRQQQQQGWLSNSSSSGGGTSNGGASTPLSEVGELYSLPYSLSSPRQHLVLPNTPTPTPEDSAQRMGGRSPMLSGAGAACHSQDMASLALQGPAELLQQAHAAAAAAQPSWATAASSSGGGCGGSNGGSARSSTAGPEAGVTSPQQQQQQQQSSARSSFEATGAPHCTHQQQQQAQQQQQQEEEWSSGAEQGTDPASLERPGCPSPPDQPCHSRASAVSTVGPCLPSFSSSSSNTNSSSHGRGTGCRGSSSSSSSLNRAVSHGGPDEQQRRRRHRSHLQGVMNGVWRGGSEGGSPMVAAIAEAAAEAAAAAGDDAPGYTCEEVEGAGEEEEGEQDQACEQRRGREDSEGGDGGWGREGAVSEGMGENGVSEGDVLAVSLNGGLSGGSSAAYEVGDIGTANGAAARGSCCSEGEGPAGASDVAPFSRSPTFAELAQCSGGGSNSGCGQHTGNKGGLQAAAAAGPGAAWSANGAFPEEPSSSAGLLVQQQQRQLAGSGRFRGSSNGGEGADSSSAQQGYMPDLRLSEGQQQQQQQCKMLTGQGSVSWEDWGQQQQQAQQQGQQDHCNGSVPNGSGAKSPAAAAAAEAPATAEAVAAAEAGPEEGRAGGLSSNSGDSGGKQQANGLAAPFSGDTAQPAVAVAPSAAAAAAAAGAAAVAAGAEAGAGPAAAGAGARSGDVSAAASSRLGDPRRSRHYLDPQSESSSVAGEDEIQPDTQQALQPPPQQPQLSYSAHMVPSAAAAAAGPGAYGGSSGGGGGSGLWHEQHAGGSATPQSWGNTPRSTPQQYHSAATTPSAGVTPRGGRGYGHRSGSSSSSYYLHHSYAQQWQQQQQQGGRRSVDLQQQQQQQQHPYAHLQHQQQQQHLLDNSSGGGSGLFSPTSRLGGVASLDSSYYRRAESVTSMTSVTTSVGGDLLLQDDQPGSSRMSLIGEHSSYLTYSMTGGRFSGFTGGAAASNTGHFSECATPRSTMTDVFRGPAEGQQGQGSGVDAGGPLPPGTSYMRYRGEYILPATHLPAAPQGPAVLRVSGASGLSLALNSLLQEPLERRSRGHAAAQAAAKLASGLVSTVWHVVDDMVVTPALQDFVAHGGLTGDAAAQHTARAPRIPGHPRI